LEFEYYGRREEAIILEQERMEEVAKKEIEKIIKINKKKLNEASLNVLNIEGTAEFLELKMKKGNYNVRRDVF